MVSWSGLEPEVPYGGYDAQPSNAAAGSIGAAAVPAVRGGTAGVKTMVKHREE